MRIYDHKTIGGILLVAGTSIGAGMLALPITTGMAGFFNAAGLFVGCFCFMLLALFVLLEANLNEPSMEANIISMAKKHLGVFGQLTGWISFLLLLYAVAAAYISAGGSLLAKFIFQGQVGHKQALVGIYGFATIFALIVYFGAWLVDYINRFMMLGLIVSYVVLVAFISPHVQFSNLVEGHPKYLLASLPVVILSFTAHIIVPTLRMYLKNNVQQLKRALIIGSLIPLLFYLVWEFNVTGVVPIAGKYGLESIAKGAHPVAILTESLHRYLGVKWVAAAFGSFSFFALVTSFLAVLLSLVDFLSDGLQIKKTHLGMVQLLLITLIPPLIFAVFFPSGFVLALSYAGVFVAILYGIIPPLMVWRMRYRLKITPVYQAPGGKSALVSIFVGAMLVILLQIASTLNLLPALG